ncbi:hypothetical protein SDC9_198294 [bioreactor metagenome]|uniref:Uncharacterized protein n=1 Tax=bioreactor metagenome TaxID=1076179 RepID=A0A645IIK1_9ZZZZ
MTYRCIFNQIARFDIKDLPLRMIHHKKRMLPGPAGGFLEFFLVDSDGFGYIPSFQGRKGLFQIQIIHVNLPDFTIR